MPCQACRGQVYLDALAEGEESLQCVRVCRISDPRRVPESAPRRQRFETSDWLIAGHHRSSVTNHELDIYAEVYLPPLERTPLCYQYVQYTESSSNP
jgi:hypothetical protein